MYSGFFMKLKIMTGVLSVLLGFRELSAQDYSGLKHGYGISIIPEVIYVSSANIQLYPYSTDLFERNFTQDINGNYGYGITIRKRIFSQDFAFGITLENVKIKDDELTQTFSNDSVTVRARVTEELNVTPLEFTGYFNLPNFTENMNIFIGGGIGIYFGDRVRTVLNLKSTTISKKPGVSLIILSGMEYFFSRQISGVFEVKFREAEYSVKSEFPDSQIRINGIYYDFESELNSNVFVDGLKLSLGISYNF